MTLKDAVEREEEAVSGKTSKNNDRPVPSLDVDPNTVRQLPLARFLPPDHHEAFIAHVPSTAHASIELIKRECPSLTSIPAEHLSLHLPLDGYTAPVSDLVFRVVSEAWPAAFNGDLPLILIKYNPPDGGLDDSGGDHMEEATYEVEVERKVSVTCRTNHELTPSEQLGVHAAWRGKAGMVDAATKAEMEIWKEQLEEGKQRARGQKPKDWLLSKEVLIEIMSMH